MSVVRLYPRRTYKRPRFTGGREAFGNTGIELKYADHQFGQTAVQATVAGSEMDPTTVLCLNGVAQGDGESQRDGRRIIMKQLLIDGAVYLPHQANTADASGVTGRVKIVVFMDTATNGASPNAEDVYVDPSSGDLDAHSFRNLLHTRRFKVLWTRIFTFTPQAAAGDGSVANDWAGQEKSFNVNLKLNVPVVYSGTGNTIASIADNSIHVMAVSSPGSTSGKYYMRYLSRLRFVG